MSKTKYTVYYQKIIDVPLIRFILIMRYKYFFLLFSFLFVESSIHLSAQNPTWQWVKGTNRGFNSNNNNANCTDSKGNIYVVGDFQDSIRFGNITLQTVPPSISKDVFIVKYDEAGTVLWAKSISGASEEDGTGITCDKDDNLLVTGFSSSEKVMFDNITLTGIKGEFVFTVKYNSAGIVVWAKKGDGNPYLYNKSLGVTTDLLGNVYITGAFVDSINFGGVILKNAIDNYADMFIVKYDPDGNAQWGKSSRGSQDEAATAVTVDKDGNVFVTGFFDSDTAWFGNIPLLNYTFNLYKNIFVVKYNATGNELWARRAGGNYNDVAVDINVDTNGNAFITGYFTSSSISFYPFLLDDDPSNKGQAFLVKYDPMGTVVWAKEAGGERSDGGRSLEVDKAGNIFLVGDFYGATIIFDSIQYPNSWNTRTLYVVKYENNGHLLWVKPAEAYAEVKALSLDKNDNIIISGKLSNTIGFDSIKTDLPKSFFIAKLSEVPIITVSTSCFGSCDGKATVYPKGVPPFTYLWSNGAFTSSITACAGDYKVTIKDALGIISVAYTTIKQPEPLKIVTRATPDGVTTGICSNLSAVVTGGTKPYTYSWLPGNDTFVCPAATTTYTCTVTDLKGCSKISSATVFFLQKDASLSEIKTIDTVCGTRPVHVQLINTGMDTLKNASIRWFVNGAEQTPANWNGSIASKDSALIFLGDYVFPAGKNQLSIIVDKSNGSADAYTRNDTLIVYNSAPYNGVYTIGATGGLFPTIQSAVNAISSCGICGPVLFNIKPGTYQEQLIIPAIKGTSSKNTILFQSEKLDSNSVIIQYAGTSYYNFVINVNGAGYLKFYKLTISDLIPLSSKFNGIAISIDNNSDHIEVSNCKMDSPFGTQIYSKDPLSQHLTITNNYFSPAINSVYIALNGKAPALPNVLRITGNSFNNFEKYGIYVSDLHKGFISNNAFKYTDSDNGIQPHGISIIECTDSCLITNNSMFYKTQGSGIGVAAGKANYALIANNYIVPDMSRNPDLLVYGVAGIAARGKNAKVVHNTVVSMGTNYTCFSGGENVTVQNNIFYQRSVKGKVFRLDGINPVMTSDYNAIFSNGLYYTTSDINEWLNLGFDLNSVFTKPQFVSLTDFHIDADFSRGIVLPLIPEVSTDIEGTVRDKNSPYMGAYEFFNDPCTVVWPGDTNNDSIVDNRDVLSIGIAYNSTGEPRFRVSNEWKGFPAIDYNNVLVNDVNMKHVDCNGNGRISLEDTLAIHTNFSQIHSFRDSDLPFVTSGSGAADLYFSTAKQQYAPGDWIEVDILAGTSVSPVDKLYGIAFNIQYDGSLVQPGTEKLFYPEGLMGKPSVWERLSFEKIDAASTMAYGAVTKLNHKDVTGYGKIATFRFRAKASISSVKELHFSFSKYKANSWNSMPVYFNTQNYTVQIDPSIPTAIEETEESTVVQVYPNPFTDKIAITYSINKAAIVKAEIVNLLGETVEIITDEQQSVGTHTLVFTAKKENGPGIYFVVLQMEDKKIVRKIVELE